MCEVIFGNPWNIPLGKVFDRRKELADLKAFKHPRQAIDGNKEVGASAIILQGGYRNVDEGNKIIYHGQGGGTRSNNQPVDQKLERGNKLLYISKQKGTLIRVFRHCDHKSKYSPSIGYSYAGLYRIIGMKKTRKPGYLVYLFELERAEEYID